MTPYTTGEADPGAAYDRLHPTVQRWVWNQGWDRLRAVQAHAVAPILRGDDVIVAAATASGKTEAAWLPICTQIAAKSGTPEALPGVKAVYLGPLKALINDQHLRLESLGELCGITVHRWHGDVAGSRKQALAKNPDGILLITPESLEALFVREGPRVGAVLGGLEAIVVDEMHSFIGTERGAQLQSLMHRVELAVRRRVPRVGLSATLADLGIAAEFLRPGHAHEVVCLDNPGSDTAEIRMQLRGYVRQDPATVAVNDEADADDETVHATDAYAIAAHLYKTLRGTDNLAFANSRSKVEAYADILAKMSEDNRVPNEFFPHHGNLSKEYREDVERRLRSADTPVTAICTSTLEMGIDIGSTDAVAQLGAPGSVTALRQRLGRSGRRDQPAVLRLYVSERELDERTPPADQIRAELVQTIAMVDLMLNDKWYEPPNTGDLHLSTLMQQVMSVIAQHGGATADQLCTVLCRSGPFTRVDAPTFRHLLTDMGEADLLVQAGDGTLLHGGRGDKIVNHYSFYAAFASAEEYRLVANGRTLGSIPVDHPVLVGSMMIFTGRRWRVVAVDTQSRVIELTRSPGGRPPLFRGAGGEVADLVRQRMRAVYESDDVPAYLDRTAQQLLDEGRASYRRLGLDTGSVLDWGDDTIVFPWRGDMIMNTVAVALAAEGTEVGLDGVALTLSRTSPGDLQRTAMNLTTGPPYDPIELAQSVPHKRRDKHDEHLSDTLLARAYAARSLDLPGALETLDSLSRAGAVIRPSEPTPGRGVGMVRAEDRPTGDVTVLGVTPFAVVDLETTGFASHLDDRVVEIAIVQTDPQGLTTSTWSTLVNPGRDPGPTHVHGLTSADLAQAPRFTDLTDTIEALLAGRILVAHNAPYDVTFLNAEYERTDKTTPSWPTLCTMQLGSRLGHSTARRLDACCAELGIEIAAQHSAAGDAQATARLLHAYLREAAATGVHDLRVLGCEGGHSLTTAPVRPSEVVGLQRRASLASSSTSLVSLARLTARAQFDARSDHASNAYVDVLDRALSDHLITDLEAAELSRIASGWGLGSQQVRAINEAYLGVLLSAEPTSHERALLKQAMQKLGVIASKPG